MHFTPLHVVVKLIFDCDNDNKYSIIYSILIKILEEKVKKKLNFFRNMLYMRIKINKTCTFSLKFDKI